MSRWLAFAVFSFLFLFYIYPGYLNTNTEHFI